MDEESTGHGGPHGSTLPSSVPRPSLWPFIVAPAVLLLGLALFWADGEDNREATVPVVAGAAALVVTSSLIWAHEQGAFSREPRGAQAGRGLAARNTQVISLAIAEGELDAARSEGGILSLIENAEGSLRAHAGFEDLRVSVSPAAAGPSQALAETVWASKEAFAGYDAAKNTLLDLIAQAGDQVVPGSVQAFDMDVVRDTKESPIRFTLIHGVVALTALVIGGFAVGIVAGVVDETATSAAETPQEDPFKVIATDNKFDRKELKATAATAVTFQFVNSGLTMHNLAFYNTKGGPALAEGAVGKFTPGGASSDVAFTTPAAGQYYFQCDLHPGEMFGTFVVQ